MADLSNITCAAFDAMPEAEQRAFVIGVANGRGMTSGLFEAYAGAAEDMAGSPAEREAVASAYRTIRGLMEPLLTIDAASLLNGVRAACRRPELRDRLVIEALASVHLTPRGRSGTPGSSPAGSAPDAEPGAAADGGGM